MNSVDQRRLQKKYTKTLCHTSEAISTQFLTFLQQPETEYCRHHREVAFKSSRNRSELSEGDTGTRVNEKRDRILDDDLQEEEDLIRRAGSVIIATNRDLPRIT